MSKSLMKGLLVVSMALVLVAVLVTIQFLRQRKEPTWVPTASAPAADIPRDPVYEAAVQAELLDCAKATGEEYVKLRDALIGRARANPDMFRLAVLGSPSWEQRVAGEIVADYVVREKAVKAFAAWRPEVRRMKTREQAEPTRIYGSDFAEHAREAPMVLVESLWKGTNEKFRSQYMDVSRWNQEIVAQALGVLEEHRAREVLEWFMLSIVWDTPDSANATAARALRKLGCAESVPALLVAVEKEVYGAGSALYECADASSLPALRQAAASSRNEEVRATANDLIKKVEAQPREGPAD